MSSIMWLYLDLRQIIIIGDPDTWDSSNEEEYLVGHKKQKPLYLCV